MDGPPPPPGACSPTLTVETFPDGAPLVRAVLKSDARFALSFIHSVSLTPVRDEYVLTAEDGLRQTAEIFIAHGQGLPSSADEPDATGWTHKDGIFTLTMDRPIPRLIVRTNARYENRLHIEDQTIDLNQWGDRALELRLTPCAAPDGRPSIR